MNSINQTKISKDFITWQKQAAIKLNEKKGNNRRFVNNNRATTLLNAGYKIISKVFTARLKKSSVFNFVPKNFIPN